MKTRRSADAHTNTTNPSTIVLTLRKLKSRKRPSKGLTTAAVNPIIDGKFLAGQVVSIWDQFKAFFCLILFSIKISGL